MSAFILAMVSATAFILVVVIGFSLLARPTDAILDAFNETMANFTSQTGSSWQSFNRLNRSFHNMWFPIGAALILFAFIYLLLHAQRREYVTAGVSQ
jgi:hypothetical protein